MIIKVLMENCAHREGFRTEHGLSLYIEACGRRILFDAGQSGAFIENAGKMGVDLASVEFAVLSHGHYDHGGGLGAFLSLNKDANVYLSRHAFEAHGNAAGKYIGLAPELASEPRLIYTGDEYRLCEGLELFSCNERERIFPVDSAGLTMSAGGKTEPDVFRHEQYLLINEKGRRILISGCAHKNVLNILEWFRPDVLVGGFHFMNINTTGAGKTLLDEAARHMMRHKTVFYTCHCTGAAQYEYLRKIMKEQLHSLSCGQTAEL